VTVVPLPERDEAALADARRAVLLAFVREQLGDYATRPTVTVEELAEILGVGRSSAYQAVREGLVPSARVGRRVLVMTGGLVALLLGCEP
jgi:excisionase family DNA binding protein